MVIIVLHMKFCKILQTYGKKTVLVYLHGSFETVLKRIQSRGRSFEMGKELISYYRFLYDGYDEMMRKSYPKDSLIDIDVDKWDLKAFGSKPKLMSNVNPQLRAQVAENQVRWQYCGMDSDHGKRGLSCSIAGVSPSLGSSCSRNSRYPKGSRPFRLAVSINCGTPSIEMALRML